MDEIALETKDLNGHLNNVKDDSKENINQEVPMEVEKDEKSDSATEAVSSGLNDEKTVLMSREVAQEYVSKKAAIYMDDPKCNPLLRLKNEIAEAFEIAKIKNEEFMKMNRVFDSLYKDQVKFLQHAGLMTKVETQTVGVGVDLPWLAESMPGLLQNDLVKPKSENVLTQPNTNETNTSTTPMKSPLKKETSGPIECIDLTDDGDEPDPPPVLSNSNENKHVVISSSAASSTPVQNVTPSSGQRPTKHPAPLPSVPLLLGQEASDIPPKPRLKISVDKNGIVLQWDMPPQARSMKITGFEIYGYQEKSTVSASSSLWKKIGCVNPMPLPMSCTLTQFVEGFKYHFSIRAVSNGKLGHFSDPASIMFVPDTKKN